jgi:hypothetical protein
MVVSAACIVLGVSAGCFYVPPLEEVPVPLDTPPFVLGFEPDITVDLRSASDVRLAVDAVYDLNAPEDIDWGIRMHLTPEAQFPTEIASGLLRVRETQTFEDATEYDGISALLDACGILVQAKGDGSLVAVELVLNDPLPAAQRREGFEAYRVVYTWRIRTAGECP